MKQLLGFATVALSDYSNVGNEKGMLECDTGRKEDTSQI